LGFPKAPHLYFGKQSRESRLSRSSVESTARAFELHAVKESKAEESPVERLAGLYATDLSLQRLDETVQLHFSCGSNRDAGTLIVPSPFEELGDRRCYDSCHNPASLALD